MDYAAQNPPIRKGVIEPDKACLVGCVINLCQVICHSGTTENVVTPNNSMLWWGQPNSYGCSEKSLLGYAQSPSYNNPGTGPGAGSAVQQCCTNAYNLCHYVGDTSSTNYKNVFKVTTKACQKAGVPNSNSQTAICNFYNAANSPCGQPGSGGLTSTASPTS